MFTEIEENEEEDINCMTYQETFLKKSQSLFDDEGPIEDDLTLDSIQNTNAASILIDDTIERDR